MYIYVYVCILRDTLLVSNEHISIRRPRGCVIFQGSYLLFVPVVSKQRIELQMTQKVLREERQR